MSLVAYVCNFFVIINVLFFCFIWHFKFYKKITSYWKLPETEMYNKYLIFILNKFNSRTRALNYSICRCQTYPFQLHLQKVIMVQYYWNRYWNCLTTDLHSRWSRRLEISPKPLRLFPWIKDLSFTRRTCHLLSQTRQYCEQRQKTGRWFT